MQSHDTTCPWQQQAERNVITHPYGAVVTPSSETTATCGIDGLEIQRKYYLTEP